MAGSRIPARIKAVLVAMVVMGVLGYLNQKDPPKPARTVALEDLAAETPQIQAFLDELIAAARNGDHAALSERYAWGHAVQQLRRWQVGLRLDDGRWGELVQSWKDLEDFGFAGWILQDAPTYEISHIRLNPQDSEAMVAVDWTQDGDIYTMFYWMVKTVDGWRFYDLGTFRPGWRIVQQMAVNVLEAAGRPDAVRTIDRLSQFGGSYLDGQLLEQADQLDAIRLDRAPGVVRGVGHFLKAELALMREQPELALVHIEKGLTQDPAPVVLYRWRAKVCNQLGQHEQARQAAETYMDQVGPTPWARVELAMALEGLGQKEQALETYTLAAPEIQKDGDVVVGLARCLEGPEASRPLVDAVGRILPADVSGPLDALAQQLLNQERPDALDRLLDAYRKAHSDTVDVQYWLARLDLVRENPDKALQRLGKTLPRAQQRPDYGAYLDLYKRAGAAAGKSEQQIYRSLQGHEQKAILSRLAVDLFNEGKIDALSRLADLHVQTHGRTPNGLYWQAEVLVQQGQTVKADKLYTEALDKPACEQVHADIARDWAHNALVNLEQDPLEILAERSRPAVFQVLAEVLSYHKRYDELDKVVAAFAPNHPRLPVVQFWQADGAFRRDRCQKALSLLDQCRQQIAVLPDYRYRFASMQVRCLARTGQDNQAFRRAAAYTRYSGDPWLEAVVHILTGRAELALREMEKIQEQTEYDPAELYLDRDAGPILRKDPRFKAIRKRWDPPGSDL
jgi:predicted Zn-dependent protease